MFQKNDEIAISPDKTENATAASATLPLQSDHFQNTEQRIQKPDCVESNLNQVPNLESRVKQLQFRPCQEPITLLQSESNRTSGSTTFLHPRNEIASKKKKFETFGKYVTRKLQNFSDLQSTLAMKLIYEAFSYAETESLNVNSEINVGSTNNHASLMSNMLNEPDKSINCIYIKEESLDEL